MYSRTNLMLVSILLLFFRGNECLSLTQGRNYDEQNTAHSSPLFTKSLSWNIFDILREVRTANSAQFMLADALNSIETRLTKIEEDFGDQKKSGEVAAECRPPFVLVSGSCMLLELSQKLTWYKARTFCRERGADLVVFKDANTYEAILQHIKSMNSANAATSVWIGGSDFDQEDNWLWVDGSAMPRGSPYWGSTDGYNKEPGGGASQNCAFLYHKDNYYVHDVHCEATGIWLSAPLCQYSPTM